MSIALPTEGVCQLPQPAGEDESARGRVFESPSGAEYDVVIIGAGITGARLFHEFCQRGQRVLLLDHGDFASGTSQASGMMIWGGLPYLKDLDLSTVIKLCRAHDQMIGQLPERVFAQSVCYLPGRQSLRNRHIVRAGMFLYWLLGSLKRRFPRCKAGCREVELLARGRFRTPLILEEAVLSTSDCRFALEWILSNWGRRRRR